jgi:addiction module HigA family antidote
MEPAHPGEILREDVLPALGLSVPEAAAQLGVPNAALGVLLGGHVPVTAEMAVRLGKFCGNGAAFWLRLQASYDLWHAERELRAEVERIPDRAHAVA